MDYKQMQIKPTCPHCLTAQKENKDFSCRLRMLRQGSRISVVHVRLIVVVVQVRSVALKTHHLVDPLVRK
jgi:hypothetical protein